VTFVWFQPAALAAGVAEAVIASGATTVNVAELLGPAPVTVTTTAAGPTGTPCGTGTTILVLLQLVGVAVTPAKVTVLVPCEVPKFVPVIVTEVPTGPVVGARLVIVGVAPAGGMISTMLRLYGSFVGAVSLRVTLVPGEAMAFVTCCVQSEYEPGVQSEPEQLLTKASASFV